MSSINSNQVAVGLAKAATWGTAVDITTTGKLIYASQVTVNPSYDSLAPRDAVASFYAKDKTRTRLSVDVSITADLTYGGQWLLALAGALGVSTATPTEVTVGQGDYTHNIDFSTAQSGKFFTMCYLTEDDYIAEVPSLKFHSATINIVAGNLSSITLQGIGDREVYDSGASNSVADLNSLVAAQEYESIVLGGANHYFRGDVYSTGTALTSADNLQIMNATLTLQRPVERRYVLRGADTFYTLEPYQLAEAVGSLQFQLSESDLGTKDWLAAWAAKSAYMFELFVDGSQIGSGANNSFKIQIPYAKPAGAKPAGYGITAKNALIQPSITWDLFEATTAPAGMSGVTKYCRFVAVTERSATYVGA